MTSGRSSSSTETSNYTSQMPRKCRKPRPQARRTCSPLWIYCNSLLVLHLSSISFIFSKNDWTWELLNLQKTIIISNPFEVAVLKACQVCCTAVIRSALESSDLCVSNGGSNFQIRHFGAELVPIPCTEYSREKFSP